jgi:alkylation response protein AidB-like acyl-CoA dehydrogenase
MDFDWAREDAEYRAELRAFLARELPADWAALSKDGPGSDAQLEFSRAFCARLAEAGWLTQHWPSAYGGRDATPWRHAVLGEEMWAHGEPRGSQYMNVNWIGPAIMQYGSDAQKALHLPRISNGDVLWCQGFSEPNAGSDLAALRTRAEREGDVYVVNGQKIWTSYCNKADYCFLLVRSDSESQRNRGISVLLMPMDLPGVEVREIPSVVGARYFHEVFLTDVRVPLECRLGPEHEGWGVVTYALAYERVGAARYAKAALVLDQLAEHARANGRLGDPVLQERLAESRALCEAARLLAYRFIDGRVTGAPPTVDTNLARVAGTEADKLVGELALEVYGSEALAYDSFAAANFRLSMTAGVAVGATEVQLNLIAARFLELPKSR